MWMERNTHTCRYWDRRGALALALEPAYLYPTLLTTLTGARLFSSTNFAATFDCGAWP